MALAVAIALFLIVVALSDGGATREASAGCGLGLVLCSLVWLCKVVGEALGGPAGAVGGVCFSWALMAALFYWTEKK